MLATAGDTGRSFEETSVRIATFRHQGKRQVGQLSADGKHVTVLAVDGTHGAQALIELDRKSVV